MSIPNLLHCKVFEIILLCSIFSSCFPGMISSANVKLRSVEIFRTHEWFKSEPTVYFSCKGENKTVLPDIKEANVTYEFKGEESWQPLTNFPSKKCKRCGFYEKSIFKPYEMDEWEFCPSDFKAPQGVYHRFKEKEFNVSFRCSKCIHSKSTHHAPVSKPKGHKSGKETHTAAMIALSVVTSTVLIIGLAVLYKFWQKKRRQQEQARFLKLFEDMDDIEDELGLGPE